MFDNCTVLNTITAVDMTSKYDVKHIILTIAIIINISSSISSSSSISPSLSSSSSSSSLPGDTGFHTTLRYSG
jgi:hypothetical protein